jgi:hypothetical protein
MNLIRFPFERVIEINTYILENEPGMMDQSMWESCRVHLGE